MNLRKCGMVVITVLSFIGLYACNDRNNESDKKGKDSLNISDTRRNTIDTGNFLVDSSGD